MGAPGRGRGAPEAGRHGAVAHAIGIDVGSTNVKAALVDAAGGLIGAGARPLTSTLIDVRATQDAEAIWTAVVGTLADLQIGRAHV